MNTKDFVSGESLTIMGYRSFLPRKVNVPFYTTDKETLILLEKAALKLGELNAFSELVPDIGHFIRMYVVKEATVSSRIEGTQTNLKEALMKEKDILPEKREDWREVNNYIEAMNLSLVEMQTVPLSTRLLKEAHKVLLDGARGEHKSPGEFRRSQNWIGGASLVDATYIPPPFQEVDSLMGDLENFMHNNELGVSHVMRIAISHYQFETIHPFLDGNGRIGRLMITLYLVYHGLLSKPVLYLSDFFEKHRTLYYDNLMRVRTHNNLEQWLKFFLAGMVETCEASINGLKQIIALKRDCEEKRVYTLGKKIMSAKKLLDYLFKNPVIKVDSASSATGLSMVASYNLVDDFVRLGILKKFNVDKRNQVFIFNEYYEIFNK